MHICIVGAGAAGLASARQCLDAKYNVSCTVFEQTGEIGGTWVFDSRTGLNEYGLPIHSSMYKHLKTNLPKEVMGFPDFPIPAGDKSYITQQEILDFLNNYADNFKLRPHIKYYQHVKQIKPDENNKWKVTITDLKNQVDTTYSFDGIMICNGHYNTPCIPKVPGSEIFEGIQIHSHDYRDPELFRDKRVLVIGAGPSGMDIAYQISSTAKQVIMSHHLQDEIATQFPENFKQTSDVVYLMEDKAIFKNFTEDYVDAIIYCTGFKFSFPFLSEDCGVKVIENHVQPLYKHLININNPTMCFVGLPFYVCAFSMFDLQARFYLEYMKDNFKLPTKEEMVKEMQTYIQDLLNTGYQNKHAHMMGPKQGDYYKELSSMANIKPIPPVLTKLHNESSRRFLEDLLHFREDIYIIENEENFIQVQ